MQTVNQSSLLKGLSRRLMGSCANQRAEAGLSAAKRLQILTLAVAASLCIQTTASFAVDLTWDVGTPNAVEGGDGDWNTSNNKWTRDGGLSNESWSNPSRAIFGGVGGLVTLERDIEVDGIVFESSGYVINRVSGRVLQIAAPASFTVKTGVATIDAPITGAGSLNVDGDGLLVLQGLNTYSGLTTVFANSRLANNGTIGGGSVAGGVTNNGFLSNTSSGVIKGGVGNTGEFEAAGQVDGDVGNSGIGTIKTTGTFTIVGKLTNNSTDPNGVLVQSGTRLNATNISNLGSSFIVNDGRIASDNQIQNAGKITNRGRISGGIANSGLLETTGRVDDGIANTGSVLASGTVNGGITNGGIGTVETTGALIVNGTLNNTSTSAQGVAVGAGESLFATSIINATGSTIVSAGTLSSSNAIDNSGTIEASSRINANIDNKASAVIRTNGALTITGTLTNLSTGGAGDPGGVQIKAGDSLDVVKLANESGAVLSNAGTLSSGNQIDNEGTINASGRINGNIFNSMNGILNTTGDLTIAGTFTNESFSSTGIDVGLGETLTVTKLVNNSLAGGPATIVSAGTIKSDNTIENKGTINASGSIEANVYNTVNGILNTTGALTVSGTLINESFSSAGIDVGAGESLTVTKLYNNGGATIVSSGTIQSGASIENRGTINAAGSINADVNNISGALNTTGALVINGTLSNGPGGAALVDIGAGESLKVTKLDNHSNSNVVNAGDLVVDTASTSAGIITNTGTITATLDGQGTGLLNMDGGAFTGSATRFQSVVQRGGTIAAGSTIGTVAYGQTGGSIAGATINASVRVTAIGGVITSLGGSAAAPLATEVDASNATGDVIVVADSTANLGNSGIAVKTSSGGATAIFIGGQINGFQGIEATATGAASSINIVTAGVIDTDSTAIAMLADPAGGPALATIDRNITVSSGAAALVSTGNARFDIGALSTVTAANILDANSGTAVLNNSGTLLGAFVSGPGSLSINNSTGAKMGLAGVSQFGGASDQLTNLGQLNIVSDTILNNLETFTNGTTGTLDLTSSGISATTLEIGGNMINAAGSQIFMNVDLDDTNGRTASDRITVVGDLSSSGGVLVLANLDPSNSFGQVTNLTLLQAGTIGAGTFSVLTPGNQSIFTYQATTSGTNIVLNSIIDPQAAGGVVSNFIAAQNAVSNAFFKPASGFVSSPLDPEPNQLGFSVWSRASGGFTSQGSKGVAILAGGPQAVESSVKVGFGGYQFGIDGGLFNIADSGANLHLGLTAGQVFGVAKQDDVNNKTDMQDTFIGAYGIFSNGPFFVDAQLRQEFIEYTVNVDDRGFRVQDGKDSSQRFSAGVSGGYSFNVGKFSIVPAVGYTFARTTTDSLSFNPGPTSATVSFEDTTSHLAFAGISAATSFLLLDDQLRVSPFISLTAYHDFGKDQEATLAVNTGTGLVEIDVTSGSAKTYGEVSLGANFLTLTPEIAGTQRLLSGNVRGDVQFGEDRLGGSFNAQLRLQF